MGKGSACSTGDTGDVGSIPGSGRSPGGGNGNPLQYSWLKNLMDRGTWQALVQTVAKSWTWQALSARSRFAVWRQSLLHSTVRRLRLCVHPLPSGLLPIQVTAERWLCSLCWTACSHQVSIVHTVSIVYVCQLQASNSLFLLISPFCLCLFSSFKVLIEWWYWDYC